MTVTFKGINPKTIAVIGASSNPDKVGHQVVANLIEGGFAGRVVPINPKGGEILGLSVSKSLSEIAVTIDLAVLVIPSPLVKDAVRECIQNNIKNLIIISAGFSEIGEEGRLLENEIAKLCEDNDVSMIGPNCLGIIDTAIGLNATFAKGMPKAGSVSMISQSGAIISSMISMSHDMSTGFAKIFSLGNKAVVGEAELLDYLYKDEATKVIIGYIESLTVSPDLTATLLTNAKRKPTVLLFGGKSALGAKAAQSHTGSVVTSYLAVKTYLEQAGVVLASDLEDLLLKARIFSSYQQIAGSRVAIVTNAGGPAIAASDAVSAAGLNLAKLDEETTKQLEGVFRPEAALSNPVDILGDASAADYEQALKIVANDSNVDAVLLLLTPQTSTDIDETAQVISNFKSSKPIISSFVGGEILTKAKDAIELAGKPCYSYPEEAVLAIKSLVDFVSQEQTISLPSAGTEEFLSEQRDAELEKFGLPIVRYERADSSDHAVLVANKIGYPVVAKTANTDSHKSDNGGVIVNIKNDNDLRDAAQKIGFPVVIGPMIRGTLEIMLGIKKDESVGTCVLFGTGGIYSEIYADFASAIAPLSLQSAKKLIMSTKMGTILSGVRGQEPHDLDRLAEIIVNAAKFADNYKNIIELDFNPIIATEDDFHLVDVRIIASD